MTPDPDAIGRVVAHLRVLYPDRADLDDLAVRLIGAIDVAPRTSRAARTPPADRPADDLPSAADPSRWTADDAVLITYADSVRDGDRPPLQVLRELVTGHLAGAVGTVHVLPFFPSTSDHGFSIVDHRSVDPALGIWDDVVDLAGEADLMIDLVCNHLSAGSPSFAELVADRSPGRDWFVTVDPDADVSAVVRPRALPLLYRVDTAAGDRWVWCTFGPDQVDLDLANPEVLVDLTGTLGLHVAHGARFIRLDAVAYLWKELGTPCIHLGRTHETVRLWRTLLDLVAPSVSLATETNVPSAENLSYFGDGDEAHIVYNFSLPPLLVDAVLSGRSDRLVAWLRSAPPAPPGCTFLNFLASHDGIGVRPAEGILSPDEIDELVARCHERGGLHGTYDTPAGPRPYELNIALWDLFSTGEDDLDVARQLCAHAVVLGLAGIPAVWINALFARGNDQAAVERTGVRREISRSPMTLAEATELVEGSTSARARATAGIVGLLRARACQRAFAPHSPQAVVDLGPAMLGIRRGGGDTPVVTAVVNFAAAPLPLDVMVLGLDTNRRWHDLIGGLDVDPGSPVVLGAYQCLWLTEVGD